MKMRISELIFFCFAILAVTLAETGSTSKKKAREVEKSSSESRKKDATLTNEAKKKSESLSITNPSKKPSQKRNDKDKLDIEKDLTTLLKEDSDGDIPLQDKLTSNTDPITLGQKINKMTNPKKKKELIAKLKKAWIQNRRSLPGKFYQAVYASLVSAQKVSAADSKSNQSQSTGKNIADESNKLRKAETDSFGGTGPGNTPKISGKLGQPDLLSMVLQQGESALPDVVPGAGKHFGKVTDKMPDALGNAPSPVEAITGNVKPKRAKKN